MLARRPSVFVRPLSMDEGRRIQKITRTSKDPVRLRRAIVVMMSGQGQTVRDITSLLQVSDDYVRDVIHAFNERGFDALNPKWSGGRRKRIGESLSRFPCKPRVTNTVNLSQRESSRKEDDERVQRCFPAVGSRPRFSSSLAGN